MIDLNFRTLEEIKFEPNVAVTDFDNSVNLKKMVYQDEKQIYLNNQGYKLETSVV
jgi:hypothetical protein